MDKAYDYLASKECDFYFNAGNSTIALHGRNLLNETGQWRIGFANPSLDYNYESYLATISISGSNFLSTSGDYQQYFTYEDENNNNRLMHHIIDPYTGVSNNNVRSVSLISNDCSLAILDALSTTIFNAYDNNEILNVVSMFETTYNCDINYIIGKPHEVNNYTDIDLYINEEIYGDLYNIASNVIDIEVL